MPARSGRAEDVVAASKQSYELEASLYEPIEKWLRVLANDLELDQYFIETLAWQGRRNTGGVWTRPDLVLVSTQKFIHYPGTVLEVRTFEVKLARDAVLGVYETAAHSRMATRSHLLVYVDDAEEREDLLVRAADECERFGLGFITFTDPDDHDSFDIRVEPKRLHPDPAEIDEFINIQVSEPNRHRLAKWVRG